MRHRGTGPLPPSGGVWRGDLLWLLAGMDDVDRHVLNALGFRRGRTKFLSGSATGSLHATARAIRVRGDATVAPRELRDQPLIERVEVDEPPFFRVTTFRDIRREGTGVQWKKLPDGFFQYSPKPIPRRPPLASWNHLREALLERLRAPRSGTDLDTRQLVEDLARGRLPDPLPRIQEKQVGRILVIRDAALDYPRGPDGTPVAPVVDSLAELGPDMDEVCLHLLDEFGPGVLQVRSGFGSELAHHQRPYRDADLGQFDAVLLFSDLGRYCAQDEWIHAGRRLRDLGLRTVALVPCPEHMIGDDARGAWDCIVWDEPSRSLLGVSDPIAQGTLVDLLYLMVAGCPAVPRGMLRELRLLLSDRGADISTEMKTWFRRARPAMPFAEDADRRAAQIRDMVLLSPELRSRMAAVWKRWLNGVGYQGPDLFAEAILRPAMVGCELEGATQARAYFARVFGHYASGNTDEDAPGAGHLMDGILRENNEDLLADAELGPLLRVALAARVGDGTVADEGDEDDARYELMIDGKRCRLLPSDAQHQAQGLTLGVSVSGRAGLAFGSSEVGREVPVPDGGSKLHLVDRGCEWTVEEVRRPWWASGMGADQEGLWADLDTGEERIRLSWVVPGQEGSSHREDGYWQGKARLDPESLLGLDEANRRFPRSVLSVPRDGGGAATSQDRSVEGPEVNPRWAVAVERGTEDALPWADRMGRDAYGIWAEWSLHGITHRMRWISPGRFWMGSPEDEEGRWDDEPLHEVELTRGFWLGEMPCTQDLWEAVMGENPSRFKSGDRPVESITFEQVAAFIERLNEGCGGGFRLPTEAEWEYACRAGTRTATYAGSMTILGANNAPILEGIAWYGGNSGVEFDLEEGHDASGWEEKAHEFSKAGTRRVGQKLPNPWGLYGMLGNVWERCSDWYADDLTLGQEGLLMDPTGPESGGDRVVRGGSWCYHARYVRAAYRDAWLDDDDAYGLVGFRLARGHELKEKGERGGGGAPGEERASAPRSPREPGSPG